MSYLSRYVPFTESWSPISVVRILHLERNIHTCYTAQAGLVDTSSLSLPLSSDLGRDADHLAYRIEPHHTLHPKPNASSNLRRSSLDPTNHPLPPTRAPSLVTCRCRVPDHLYPVVCEGDRYTVGACSQAFGGFLEYG